MSRYPSFITSATKSSSQKVSPEAKESPARSALELMPAEVNKGRYIVRKVQVDATPLTLKLLLDSQLPTSKTGIIRVHIERFNERREENRDLGQRLTPANVTVSNDTQDQHWVILTGKSSADIELALKCLVDKKVMSETLAKDAMSLLTPPTDFSSLTF